MGKTAQCADLCEAKGQQIEPFFSIIIPAYNAELFIGDCLNSIVFQEFKDYEIIVIDDGSLDNTLKKINAFAARFSQIQVIHFITNQGAAAAKNRGIYESRGKYIIFVDADDTVAEDFLTKLYTKVSIENIKNLKLIVFGIVEEYFNRNNKQIGRKEIIPVACVSENKREIRKAVIELERQTLYGYLCNKVYNGAYLKGLNINIPEMEILEDIYFNIQYCQDIDSIIVMDMAPYTYKKRYGTLTGRRIPDYYEIHKERMRLLIAQYKSWDLFTDGNRQALALAYTRYLFSAVQRIKNKEVPIEEANVRAWLEQVFAADEVYGELIETVDISSNSIGMFMCRALKEKNTLLILTIAKVIGLTQRWMRPLYLKIK